MPNHRLRPIAVASLVASLVALGSCSSTTSSTGSDVSSSPTSSTPVEVVTTSSSVPGTATTGATGTTVVAATTPVTSPATTKPTTKPTTAPTVKPPAPPTTAPVGPKISSFSMSSPASCGTPPAPDASFVPPPTNPPVVTITWKAAGADSVYVAIDNRDGPYYSDRPLDGSVELNFNCPGPHTFWVVAVKVATKDYRSTTFG